MKAIYITYAIEEHISTTKNYSPGQIVSVEVKTKGMAPKVSDWPRESWQSVVRYSKSDSDRYMWISILSNGLINEDRNLVMGENVVLEEDTVNSLKCVSCIENE